MQREKEMKTLAVLIRIEVGDNNNNNNEEETKKDSG